MISPFINSSLNFRSNINRKMTNLNDFIPSKSVLVHMSDYMPVDGVILSSKNASIDKDGLRKIRNTIHFAFNQSVPPNKLGLEWNNKPIGIIAPFDGVILNNPHQNILGGQPQDFYIKDKVKLPEGAVIVRYSKKVPKGVLRVINAEKIDLLKNTKGIKIVETSNNVRDVTNDYIEKMGYSRLDKLYAKEASLSNELSDMDFELRNDIILRKKSQYNSKDISKMINADRNLQQSWVQMANDVGFNMYKNHQSSPYGRSEFLVDSVGMLAKYDNSWDSQISAFNVFTQKDDLIDIDYKKDFISVIDNITKNLKPNEELSYDIGRFKENIITSETPQNALEKLAKEQGIKPMDENICNIRKDTSSNKFYDALNSLLDFFSMASSQ